MTDRPAKPPSRTTDGATALDDFLSRANAVTAAASGRPRLVFALDATMSRQPTWDLAQDLTSRMFAQTPALAQLDVQLVYFRGFSECRASRFFEGGAGLARVMQTINVAGGATQIGKVLTHVRTETARGKVGALVYIGDAMEENVDRLCRTAGELGLLGVKAFMFQEGENVAAGRAFRELARLTGGAYATFDQTAPQKLAGLLAAAAAYAAGGRAALAKQGGDASALLLAQIR